MIPTDSIDNRDARRILVQGTLIVEGAKYRGAITTTFIVSIVCMGALVCKGALKYSAHSQEV